MMSTKVENINKNIEAEKNGINQNQGDNPIGK